MSGVQETLLWFLIAIAAGVVGPVIKERSLRREQAQLAKARARVDAGVLVRYEKLVETFNTVTGLLSIVG
jgi:hypothetical protein